MVVNLGRYELEMERLARAKRVVIHRSPGRGWYGNRSGYFVCDHNNFLLFSVERLMKPRAATALRLFRPTLLQPFTARREPRLPVFSRITT